jgi:hypothetical protein
LPRRGFRPPPGRQSRSQIARDITGDIGGERAASIHRAALLSEIGQRQRENRRHAQTLRDAEDREQGEIGRDGEQGGWNGKENETQENAEPTIDMRAQKSDHEASDRHAHGAGVDRKTHRGRGHVVVAGQ